MKTGCLYAFIAVALVGILCAIIVPNILKGNVDRVAELTGEVAPFVIGIPAFIIGFRRQKKERSEWQNFKGLKRHLENPDAAQHGGSQDRPPGGR